MQGKPRINLAVARYVVTLFHIPVKTVVVVIVPQPPPRSLIPRQRTENLAAPRKKVMSEFALEVRVVFQNDTNIVDRSLWVSCL